MRTSLLYPHKGKEKNHTTKGVIVHPLIGTHVHTYSHTHTQAQSYTHWCSHTDTLKNTTSNQISRYCAVFNVIISQIPLYHM